MQATTPVDPRVLDAMLPYYHGRFGNPHSRSHSYGWDAEEAIEKAREQIARLINADAKEFFEMSNNMAIKGVAEFYEGSGKKHIVTTQTEHKCVLASCRRLEVDKGWSVTYLPVDKYGLELEDAIRDDTALVSVMHINNEIGTMQPVEEIGRICAKKQVFFHTDAAQSVGKVPVDVKHVGAALMSISAHKMYGPKGVGALYVRRKPRVRLRPVIDGGEQERGMRSGTLATPPIVGFGAAAEVCMQEMDNDTRHVQKLYKRMHDKITEELPQITLNGSPSQRWPGNVNLSFACVEGESLLMSLAKTTAVSSGSACTSASLEPSYVLRAIGVSEDLAHTSLRFGIGRFTTEAEVDNTVNDVVREAVWFSAGVTYRMLQCALLLTDLFSCCSEHPVQRLSLVRDMDAVGRKEEKSHHPSNILMRESATSSNSPAAYIAVLSSAARGQIYGVALWSLQLSLAKMLSMPGTQPMQPMPDFKSELNQFLQKHTKRPLGKNDIEYTINRYGHQQQAIVKLHCMDGQEYAGHLCLDQKSAEKSAAEQALQANAHLVQALKAGDTARGRWATKREVTGFTAIGNQYQATVQSVALPDEWAQRAWAGELCATRQKAEQSAAEQALKEP
eukprot:g1760.t1